jgi:hypothetical protein
MQLAQDMQQVRRSEIKRDRQLDNFAKTPFARCADANFIQAVVTSEHFYPVLLGRYDYNRFSVLDTAASEEQLDESFVKWTERHQTILAEIKPPWRAALTPSNTSITLPV